MFREIYTRYRVCSICSSCPHPQALAQALHSMILLFSRGEVRRARTAERPGNASWLVGYPRSHTSGAGRETSAPRAAGLNARKCPGGRATRGARAECRARGLERKHRGGEAKRTRQKVWWRAVRNVNREDSTTHPKLSQTRGPRKGEPGRSTCHSRSPARPAAARRGRTQRRLDARGPRVAPTRGAKAPPLRALSAVHASSQSSGLQSARRLRGRGVQRGLGEEKGT